MLTNPLFTHAVAAVAGAAVATFVERNNQAAAAKFVGAVLAALGVKPAAK